MSMKSQPYSPFKGRLTVLIAGLLFTMLACEDFVEIDPPTNQLIGNEVFENEKTIDAALVNVYSKLRDNSFASGTPNGLSFLLGLYTDELVLYNASLISANSFYQNGLDSNNSAVVGIWNNSYNLIYSVNRIIEGLDNAPYVNDEERLSYLGEAYFLRAYLHFTLTNLFASIPYIDTTDFEKNKDISKISKDQVYERVIQDLLTARSYFPKQTDTNQNLRANYWVSTFLLSRVYLYNEDWQLALDTATEVIEQGGYTLEMEVEQVFKENSKETVWQFGRNLDGDVAKEALTFVFVTAPPPNASLSDNLIEDFEIGDLRLDRWVNEVSQGTVVFYYPSKYVLENEFGPSSQLSIVFRLAELYFIAAESNAELGNTEASLSYLNPIRIRAGIAPLEFTTRENLLNQIYQERRVELFTEQGQRFFDLKRTGRLNSILGLLKPNWETEDQLFPLPANEIILNPGLQPQNPGY